jgi:excisionase family DNA binding protein
MEPQKQKMNVEEVSTWLHIPRTSIYRLCRKGEIPCAKISGHWYFQQQHVEVWLVGNVVQQMLSVSREG